MKLNFRDATIHDLPAIVDIYNSTVPGRIVTADTEPVSVESRVPWFEKHSPDKRPLWVIEDENKNIVGWASFQSFYGRPAYDSTVEISIYLHENARRKQIGRKALEFVINNCERLGIKTLLGFIFAHNEPSIRLFKNFGFEEWAMLPNIATLDGIDRSLIILGKRIIK